VFAALDQLESILEASEGELTAIGQPLMELQHSPFIGDLQGEPTLIQRLREIFDSYFTGG